MASATLPIPRRAGRRRRGGWRPRVATGVLVLANGDVIEGFGVGATGSAVGEVCFNTAMTGYQEILTDPSYAAQIITFTFPHIGIVGVNADDIEVVNGAAATAAVGAVFRADLGEPSNFRAHGRLDAWLKARGVVGLAGVDTRALTTLIRKTGMPNAVIAHAPDGAFDLDALRAEARRWPGIDGMDLVPRSGRRSATIGTRRAGRWSTATAARVRRASMSSPSTMASSATSFACSTTAAARSPSCRRRRRPRRFWR